MKILFLYPNKVMVSRIPTGVGYVIAYLKRDGHQVEMFDTTFIKCGDIPNDEKLRESALQVTNPPEFEKYGLVGREGDVFAELDEKLKSFSPDLVAVSAVDPNYGFGLDLLRRVKQNNKDLKTIVGGPTPTFAPEEVIAEDCVDMLCVGEGEEAISELCKNLESGADIKNIKNLWVKEGGVVYKNSPRPLINLNDVLDPEWDIFDDRHIYKPLGGKIYRMGIFSITRGCLFRCTYCANYDLARTYKGKGDYYRMKDIELSIKELETYKKKYNLNFIFFVDDLFPLHKEDVLDEFCRLYKERVGLPFSISLHPTLVKEGPFSKIVEAGCRNICVGLESGSPEIRKIVLQRTYKNEQVVNVFKMARKYKIRSSAFNMIGMPFETRENIFETIALSKEANPTTTTLTFLHPYRGTALRKLCIEEKFFDPTKEQEYENVYRAESCLKLPQISSEELRGIFKTFQLYVKLPKMFYELIRIAESDSALANFVMKFLKKIFYYVTGDEQVWNFRVDYDHPLATRENSKR